MCVITWAIHLNEQADEKILFKVSKIDFYI